MVEFVDAALAFELLQIGQGDLQAVEENAGGLLVDEFLDQRLHDPVEGELQAGSVLDDGQRELGRPAGGLLVEAAEATAATGRLAAGQSVELDMLAAWRLKLGGINWLVRAHGYPLPPS